MGNPDHYQYTLKITDNSETVVQGFDDPEAVRAAIEELAPQYLTATWEVAYCGRCGWTDGHRDAAALRKTGKAILKDLYRVARKELEGRKAKADEGRVPNNKYPRPASGLSGDDRQDNTDSSGKDSEADPSGKSVGRESNHVDARDSQTQD